MSARASGIDELDALIAGLSSTNAPPSQSSSYRAPAATSPPTSAAKPNAGGGGGPSPRAGGGGPSPRAAAGVSAAPRATPRSAAAAAYAGPSGGKDDDLKDLLSSLNNQMSNVADGNVASKGICSHCRQPILGEVMTAMGKTFHIDHFICSNCQVPIGTKSFYEVEGQVQCEGCYRSTMCPRCAHCDGIITDRCITALGKKWHPDHFVCSQCLQAFPNGSFFERDGRPYCETHFYAVHAPTCAACNQPIKGDCTNALGQQWHPEHFACVYCNKAFGGAPFFEHQGKPYCEAHYNQTVGSICAGCNKPIAGRSVQALDKKWHPEHFVCSFCMNPLSGTNYTEKSNKAYCKGCADKLFS